MGNAPSSGGQAPHPDSVSGDPNDPEYWRRKGDAYAQARNAAFAASQAAYRSGNHGEAGRQSREGKRLDARCKECNARAADLAFARNNAGRGRGVQEVDLHGLRVAEAEAAAERAIQQAREAGLSRMVFIVGKGLHSADGVARVRPAVERLLQRHNLRCTPGVPNAGCITVEFVSAAERGWVGAVLDTLGRGCAIC